MIRDFIIQAFLKGSDGGKLQIVFDLLVPMPSTKAVVECNTEKRTPLSIAEVLPSLVTNDCLHGIVMMLRGAFSYPSATPRYFGPTRRDLVELNG